MYSITMTQETGPLRVPPMPLRNELSPRRGAKALTAPTPLSTALLFHACVSLPFLSHLPIYPSTCSSRVSSNIIELHYELH